MCNAFISEENRKHCSTRRIAFTTMLPAVMRIGTLLVYLGDEYLQSREPKSCIASYCYVSTISKG